MTHRQAPDCLSVGIGLMTETGNIDLAYRQELNGTARLLAIGVRLGPERHPGGGAGAA